MLCNRRSGKIHMRPPPIQVFLETCDSTSGLLFGSMFVCSIRPESAAFLQSSDCQLPKGTLLRADQFLRRVLFSSSFRNHSLAVNSLLSSTVRFADYIRPPSGAIVVVCLRNSAGNQKAKKTVSTNKCTKATAGKCRRPPAIPSGTLPVALPPRYHDPISVSWPFWVKNATFSPTLQTSLRKDPK